MLRACELCAEKPVLRFAVRHMIVYNCQAVTFIYCKLYRLSEAPFCSRLHYDSVYYYFYSMLKRLFEAYLIL